MPRHNGRLTDQEKHFASGVAATGNPVYAAAIAGYRHPGPRASHNLTKPAVQEEIRKQQLARLHNDVLPMAINVLRAALDLDHAGVPWGSRVTAAKIVTDRVFNDAQTGANKDMADMTADELKERMAQLQGRLAEMAKPIVDASAEPVDEGAFE
jgi:phage terminase small subunit